MKDTAKMQHCIKYPFLPVLYVNIVSTLQYKKGEKIRYFSINNYLSDGVVVGWVVVCCRNNLCDFMSCLICSPLLNDRTPPNNLSCLDITTIHCLCVINICQHHNTDYVKTWMMDQSTRVITRH